MFDDAEIRAELREVLPAGSPEVDLERLRRFCAAIVSGELSTAANRVKSIPTLAGSDDVQSLAALHPDERERLRALGAGAIAAGEFAVCVLNGGMATRFGGDVKGVIEAIGGRSFLEIKHAQARAHGPVPFRVMNSFATHSRTAGFVADRGLDGVESFLQDVSLRLTPAGAIFRGSDGRVSPYAPGHGDFPGAIRDSGVLDDLRARGVRTVMLSNVDNLGAGLDPLIAGVHLDRGRLLTTELAETVPGDVGGAPARVGDHIEILEGFRFPVGFDFSSQRFIATNTFWLSVELLAEPHRLDWYYVEKTVEGAPAVQIEHLVNELSARVPTAYLAVPRGGLEGRFYPIKTRDHLAALRADDALVARFSKV